MATPADASAASPAPGWQSAPGVVPIVDREWYASTLLQRITLRRREATQANASDGSTSGTMPRHKPPSFRVPSATDGRGRKKWCRDSDTDDSNADSDGDAESDDDGHRQSVPFHPHPNGIVALLARKWKADPESELGFRVIPGLDKFYGYEAYLSYSAPCQLLEFPFTQATDGVLYEKEGAMIMHPEDCDEAVPVVSFPLWNIAPLPHRIPSSTSVKDVAALASACGVDTCSVLSHWYDTSLIQQPRADCDVFVVYGLASSSQATEAFLPIHRALLRRLDQLAQDTNDFPVPQYQYLVDPNLHLIQSVAAAATPAAGENQAASSGAAQTTWAATDVLVEERLIGMSAVMAWTQRASEVAGQRVGGRPLRIPTAVLRMVRAYLPGTNFPCTARIKAMGPVPGVDFSMGASTADFEEDSTLAQQLHTSLHALLESAMPLLARLRRPALLLPGRLQVVAKAQRIFLTPKKAATPDGGTAEDDASAAYEGIWHQDGLREHVVAVVLYYYRVSPELEGGDLEFLDRRPAREWWIGGDCNPDSYSDEDARKTLEELLPHTRVPVRTGTMVAFSNQQLVHRVLRTTIKQQAAGSIDEAASPSASSPSSHDTAEPPSPHGLISRDFVAFFVLDQRYPLPSSQNPDYQLADQAEERQSRLRRRREYFTQQLQPSGIFGLGHSMHSTGNGSVASLGMLQRGESSVHPDDYYYSSLDRSALPRIALVNKLPPLRRGLSWTLEADLTAENLEDQDEELEQDEDDE